MAPRWESPLDRPSHRDAALLAEVLGALREQLGEQLGDPAAESARAEDGELSDLISAAMAELHRVAPPGRSEGGVAPVLGSGVVQELLRRQRDGRTAPAAEPPHAVDTTR